MAILRIIDLIKQFGGLAALSNVSIDVTENEILGIIGPNGAGKTTFINVIAGIYPPTNGKILFQGEDISEMPAYRRSREGIVRTFQLVRPLEDLTLLENVMVGSLFGRGLRQREARRKAQEICEFVGIVEIQREATRLTALETKMMEIAHALSMQPKILFLDEVMAGLNTDEMIQMIELVRKIHDTGITIVIIEHVMRVIKELTHRVIVLDWGEIIAQGPYEEVSNNPKVISAYLGEEA